MAATLAEPGTSRNEYTDEPPSWDFDINGSKVINKNKLRNFIYTKEGLFR